MAPRKRKTGEQETTAKAAAVVAQSSNRRVTRSLTLGASSANSAESRPEAPARKKAKVVPKKKGKAKAKAKDEDEAEEKPVKEEKDEAEESEEKAEADGEKGEEAKEEDEGGEDATEDVGEESSKKTIVVEHCTQCRSFKTRAIQVKDGLEKGVSGITVLLNPDKPRRGCFEIREESGETFISLLDLKRPFNPMKALNMEEVIDDIIEKIK